jgi:PAS domain S-box-containing protein
MPNQQQSKSVQLDGELFRLLVESIQDYAVVLVDPEGRIESWNQGAEKLLGYQAVDVIGRCADDLFSSDDIQSGIPEQVLHEALESGRANDDGWRMRRDASRFWLHGRTVPLCDERGSVLGFAKIMSDRADLWRAPDELASHTDDRKLRIDRRGSKSTAEEKWELLVRAGIPEDITTHNQIEHDLKLQARVLESMTEGVSLSNEDGIIVYTNPAEDRMFGYERGELIGQHVSIQNTYPAEDNQRIVADVIRRLKTEGDWSGEFSNRRKDGSQFRTYARITALEMGSKRYFVCVQEDITKRKQVETALQDARSRLNAALEAGSIATWTWDIPSNRLYADETLARVFNLPASDADGGLLEKYIQSIHPEDQPRVKAALRESIESGREYDADYRIMQRDGSVRWVVARGRVERDEKGRSVRMTGVLVDITERKRAEEELRHSERTSRFLAEATTAVAGLTDYESTLRRVAELAVPFFADWCIVDIAEPEQNVLRRLAVAHVDPDKVELVEELRRQYPPRATDPRGPQSVFRTGQPEMASDISDELLVSVAKDGDHLRILRGLGLRSYICVPMLVRGRVTGVLTFITAESGRTYNSGDLRLAEDLAHRTALAIDNASLYATARQALRLKDESLALLDTLQQNAPVGFAFVDRQFRYVRINDALAAIDGNVPEYHLGRTVQETVPKLWPRLEPLYRGVLQSGKPVRNQEVTGETPAAPGQIRHWLVNYYPVQVQDEIVGVGVLVTDITQQKRLEEELRQQAIMLTEADRRKDEFLATLAHELRNPLAPIRNSLQILKMPQVDAVTAQQTKDMLERQVHHLVRLVDDLLDVSRVMRGKIELRKEPVELATVVAGAVETAQPLMELQGHELEIMLPPESLLLHADPVRLAQVIGNLLTNAAKYTDANGRIELTAQRDGGAAVLRVRDTGIGIAPDMLPHVFELFVQVDHAATRAQGGLGIGLTLVKNLVEMHNGRVEVYSDGLGKGCEFLVRLPLLGREHEEPAEKENSEAAQHTSPTRLHLLVVDDNQDAAVSLAMLLRLQGHDVRVAYDGPSALELAKSLTPDVVFLDLGMPGMDGFEVARRIRATNGLENTVVAALTGWGQQEDRRRTEEAGFNHHLVKPPEPKALEALLTDLTRTDE